jgi:hypothetical protein
MTEAEAQIVAFLECSPESFFSRKEIARRAVRRQEYEANPHWADAALSSLTAQGLIEQDLNGTYRCKAGRR